jgi:hypothetical protein
VTRVTKSGAGVDADRGRADDREQSGSWGRRWQLKTVEVEGKTAIDLYVTLGPLPARLRHDQDANPP